MSEFLVLKPGFLLFYNMKKKFCNMENILIKKKEYKNTVSYIVNTE